MEEAGQRHTAGQFGAFRLSAHPRLMKSRPGNAGAPQRPNNSNTAATGREGKHQASPASYVLCIRTTVNYLLKGLKEKLRNINPCGDRNLTGICQPVPLFPVHQEPVPWYRCMPTCRVS